MLDDIDKIIPKLDEKDSEVIYQKLSNKKVGKKSSIFNNRIIVAFATFVLLIFVVIPVGIMINNSNLGPNQPSGPSIEPEDNELQYDNNSFLNENSVIGIAAFKEFDEINAQKLSNLSIRINYKNSDVTTLDENSEEPNGDISDVENEIDEPLKVTYPYDYVKINSAYKFSINVINIEDNLAKEIIESNCGLGDIEVVVAEFETYVEENGYNVLFVQDTLICLRGYNGYYTILANSGHREEGDWTHIFSSHKKLLEDEVSKDFTPPILSIFLEEKSNNERYVYFETSDNLLSFGSYDRNKAFKNTTEIEHVSRSTMYSVLELTRLPVKEVEASVLEIDLEYKMLKVQTDYNLEYVHIDENTEDVNLENINIGDIIIVEYDFLFDEYNPIKVTANSITIKPSYGDELNEKINNRVK